MKLLIGIPSYDYMHAEFVKCLTALTMRLCHGQIPFDVFINNGTLVYMARDRIACKAINEGYTHVLWLDSDMIFSSNILDDLMDCRQQMVSGIAASRRKPFALCVFRRMDDINHLERYESYPSEPFRIAGCGFACVLTDVDILRAVQTRYRSCFLPEHDWGEDLTFCRRVTALGYQIWADPAVRLGHIGHEVIWPEDHDKYLKSLEG